MSINLGLNEELGGVVAELAQRHAHVGEHEEVRNDNSENISLALSVDLVLH